MKPTKDIRNKIIKKKKIYQGYIEQENKAETKSLNYVSYFNVVKEMDNLLFLLCDYDELPNHTVDYVEMYYNRIDKTGIL